MFCYLYVFSYYDPNTNVYIFGVKINEFAMVGDQIFADVMAANNCGAIAILVDALKGRTRFPVYYAIRRRKSIPIIKEFEKLHGYGYYD